MERLTERDEFGNAYIIALSDMMPEIYAEFSFSETNALTDALNRLAAYEDAIPLERAQELAQAEKGGRLLLLPCKVGDTVYAITSPINIDGIESEETIDIFECKIESITFYSKCRTQLRLFYQGIFVAVLVTVDDFGKTVFLTREEAEAALKKGEADNETD